MLAERGTTGETAGVGAGRDRRPARRAAAAEKELLQEAAVLGKVFWLGGVASALRADEADAERLLRSLERKDFVRRERHSTVAGDTSSTRSSTSCFVTSRTVRSRGARGPRSIDARPSGSRGSAGPTTTPSCSPTTTTQALELSRAAGVEDDPSSSSGRA